VNHHAVDLGQDLFERVSDLHAVSLDGLTVPFDSLGGDLRRPRPPANNAGAIDELVGIDVDLIETPGEFDDVRRVEIDQSELQHARNGWGSVRGRLEGTENYPSA